MKFIISLTRHLDEIKIRYRNSKLYSNRERNWHSDPVRALSAIDNNAPHAKRKKP